MNILTLFVVMVSIVNMSLGFANSNIPAICGWTVAAIYSWLSLYSGSTKQ